MDVSFSKFCFSNSLDKNCSHFTVLEHFQIIFLLGHLFGSCIHWFKDANICSSNYFFDYKENIRHRTINLKIWVLGWPEKHPQWDIGYPGFSDLTECQSWFNNYLAYFRLVFSLLKSCHEWPWDFSSKNPSP